MAGECIVRESPKEHQTFGETRSRKRDAPFLGFDVRSTTPVPNQVFDELLPALGEPELKVLLYIARQTLGCGRPEAPISLNPFHGDSTTPAERPETACGVIFLTLEDEHGHVPCVVWPQVYRRYRALIKEPVLLARGAVPRRDSTMNVVVRHLEAARAVGQPPRSRDWG